MRIKIVCIGKLKEKYLVEATKEYEKRLGQYCKLDIVEVKESKLPANPSLANEEKVKEEEGKSILKHLGEEEYVITLEVKGEKLSSEKLASHIGGLGLKGKSNIAFVIGGSLGLSAEVSCRSNMKLSFSDMTFTHQMIRVLLLEQIYRCFKINKGEAYHK